MILRQMYSKTTLGVTVIQKQWHSNKRTGSSKSLRKIIDSAKITKVVRVRALVINRMKKQRPRNVADPRIRSMSPWFLSLYALADLATSLYRCPVPKILQIKRHLVQRIIEVEMRRVVIRSLNWSKSIWIQMQTKIWSLTNFSRWKKWTYLIL